MNENKYDKNYYEKYAMLSLVYCYNDSWNSFIHSDKPDLQSSSLNIGIEVTRAISQYEGLCDSIVNKYFGKGLNGEFIKNEIEQKCSNFKGEVDIRDNVTRISYTKGLYNTMIHLDEIKEAIVLKTSKLNNNYKIFNENHLYLFTETSLIEKLDIKNKLSNIKESIISYKINFNLLFINCLDRIFIVDMSSQKIQEILIDDITLRKLKAEAMK